MNKTLIIILREYSTRVSKKSFILLTLLMPILFVAIGALPVILGQIRGADQKEVVVIDKTGKYLPLFKSDEHYHFTPDTKMREEYKSEDSDVEAVVMITADLTENSKAITISGRSEIQGDLRSMVEDIIGTQVRKDRLAKYEISNLDNIISDVEQEFSVTTVKWNKDGEETFSSSDIAVAAGFLFTFLIYMFVMAYGGMVMQSVMEEKTNRIMEIMVSSVKPFQLMMGKIIGVALVGFTQILIWAVLVGTIFTALSYFVFPELTHAAVPGADMAAMSGADPAVLAKAAEGSDQEMLMALMNLPFLEMGIMFVLYFIGGYLLFASFFAAVGASVNSQEDSSQFTLPVVMIMIFGLYAAMGSAENTNGPLAFWSSMFPITAPIVMMVRIPFDVPLWQELLSLAILYSTAIGMTWVAAKIYRVGILMYGKKPSIKEMIKWIRYK